jgi:hypothetical protein
MLSCLIPAQDCPYGNFISLKHDFGGLYASNVFSILIRKPWPINLSFIFTAFSYSCWQGVRCYLC